ncbi:uncharacterized protein [Rutidosis leptorrhynchoides]|uniref:uncharacterized protein n=1 Tax=Rutidosis leptorrhynchoides TaxID=125765 RepID=UPI003A99B902
MAQLFIKQAKQYAETRPSYPPELFRFIASKTPFHDLVWDVGTGSGQAAQSLAGIYKNVIATDTSLKQLEFARKLPNIQYKQTPPSMSISELQKSVSPNSSVDLITIAQALHWFDLPNLYEQVKWILKKPNGIISAWCYTTPKVNDSFNAVFDQFYAVDSKPYWDAKRKLIDEKYMTVDFPFVPVDGENETGPFEFKTEKVMDLEEFLTYLRSWSAYQTAKDKGVELLSDDVIEKFKVAWDEDGVSKKSVKFPVYLRIGKVGNCA